MHLFIDIIPSFIMLLNIRKSFSLDYALIPLRENWCWSLLGPDVKGWVIRKVMGGGGGGGRGRFPSVIANKGIFFSGNTLCSHTYFVDKQYSLDFFTTLKKHMADCSQSLYFSLT